MRLKVFLCFCVFGFCVVLFVGRRRGLGVWVYGILFVFIILVVSLGLGGFCR